MKKWEEFKSLVKRTARNLRKNQTESEMVLWQVLRNRKVSGKKFLRQHPMVFEWNNRKRFIITDFYCHEAKLIIEVDGGIHEKQRDYDKMRDFVVKSLGYRVLRFSNNDILNHLAKTIKTIKNTLVSPLFTREGSE